MCRSRSEEKKTLSPLFLPLQHQTTTAIVITIIRRRKQSGEIGMTERAVSTQQRRHPDDAIAAACSLSSVNPNHPDDATDPRINHNHQKTKRSRRQGEEDPRPNRRYRNQRNEERLPPPPSSSSPDPFDPILGLCPRPPSSLSLSLLPYPFNRCVARVALRPTRRLFESMNTSSY